MTVRIWRLMLIGIAIISAILLTLVSCVDRRPIVITAAPDHLTPPIPDAIIAIELDVPNWKVVCLRKSPAQLQAYACIEVGTLRQWVQPTLRADN